MKYRVTIRASFDYTVEVEATDKATAEAKASNELMDYLDLTIRKTAEFAYFHEYMLHEEVVSCDTVEPQT